MKPLQHAFILDQEKMQHTSDKLKYPEFIPSFNKEPLNVEYQTKTSDQFSSNGFSFYIKAPAQDALLDPDVWIKYHLKLKENAQYHISDIFENHNIPSTHPVDDWSFFCFREGHPMWRAMQKFSVDINNLEITTTPYLYMDEWNRLNVSLEQSSHEFSMSGGKFDNGNQTSSLFNSKNMGIQKGFGTWSGNPAVGDMQYVKTSANGFFHASEPSFTTATDTNINVATPQRIAPPGRYWENDGIEERHNKMAMLLRSLRNYNAGIGSKFVGNPGADLLGAWHLDLYERLPMRPFKMYDQDGVTGVIPNIKDLTIRAQFKSDLFASIFQANDLNLGWIDFSDSTCEMYLKWYTPPYGMSIPREIAIPMQRIETYIAPFGQPLYPNEALSNTVGPKTFSDIGLASIPDYLMIYLKPITQNELHCSPHNLEIGKLEISLGGISGKLKNMHTIHMYKNWLKYVKYKTEKEVHYDEWRKYNCVCILKGEDLGLMKGAGLDNPCSMSIKVSDVTTYYRYPMVHGTNYTHTVNDSGGLVQAGVLQTLAAGNFTPLQLTYRLVVLQVYDKYALKLRKDGSSRLELTRIRDLIPNQPSEVLLPARVGLGALTL